MKKTIIITLFFILSVSISAARDFEVSANAGIALNPRWDTSLTFGITGSTPIAKKIIGEAEFFYYLNAAEDPGIQGLTVSSSAWDLNLYAHYLFKLRNAKIKPYASLGVGIFNGRVAWDWGGFGAWSESKTRFNVGFGGGAKYPLNEKSGLRIDVRYIIIFEAIGDVVRLTAGYYMKL